MPISFKKYFIPANYYKKVCKLIYKYFLHNAAALKVLEAQKFEQSGLDLESGLHALNSVLQLKLGRDFDFLNDSIHWLLFAAVSKSDFKPKKILEIGTFDGEFTYILAKLFPQATIVTVDLPEDDPLLRGLYDRENTDAYASYLKIQSCNLKELNILPIKANSFFLLDNVNDKFDLIWVDGGHLYPEVAWDLCSAYHLCNSGGLILCDDVISSPSFFRDQYVSTESYEVLNYIKLRLDCSLMLFIKRRNPDLYLKAVSRKYVACLRKPAKKISR